MAAPLFSKYLPPKHTFSNNSSHLFLQVGNNSFYRRKDIPGRFYYDLVKKQSLASSFSCFQVNKSIVLIVSDAGVFSSKGAAKSIVKNKRSHYIQIHFTVMRVCLKATNNN